MCFFHHSMGLLPFLLVAGGLASDHIALSIDRVRTIYGKCMMCAVEPAGNSLCLVQTVCVLVGS